MFGGLWILICRNSCTVYAELLSIIGMKAILEILVRLI